MNYNETTALVLGFVLGALTAITLIFCVYLLFGG